MKKIPKGYKCEVKNDRGAFRLAGAIVRSLLLDIKCPTEYTREMRVRRINKIKRERLRFIETLPILRHWCDISGYSYTKTRDKIELFNKVI